jgi:cell division protein FtsB
VNKVELEFLGTLREIRAAVVAERAGGSATTGTTKELEVLRAENEELKMRNMQLEYRVKHVVSSLETLYAANKKVESL